MLTEHKFQEQVVSLLKLNRFKVFNLDVMIALRFLKNQKDRILFIKQEKKMGYTNGQPDLIVFNKKGVFFIELKNDKGKQSKEQKIIQQEVEEDGFKYFLIHNTEELLNFINNNKEV